MPIQVVNNALIKCSFGVAPSPFAVLPLHKHMSSSQPAGNIMDQIPFLNIKPFGMCTSPTNPAVIAATAAALGVLTPMPCTPIIAGPWIPGSPTVLIQNMPAINNACQCICAFAGIINVMVPGQFTHMIP